MNYWVLTKQEIQNGIQQLYPICHKIGIYIIYTLYL